MRDLLTKVVATLIEITNTICSYNFNSIFSCLEISEISLLRKLQIIFFVLFVILNMCLIFIEYLEQKSKKDKPKYLKSGSGNMVSHLKKYSTYFFVGVGALSSLITIKNEYISKAKYDKLHEEWTQSKESGIAELKKVEDKLVLNNMYTRMNYTSLDLTFQELKGIRTEKSELSKSVEADLEK